MALLNKVRVFPVSCKSSKRFVQYIPDALDDTRIHSKIVPLLSCNKVHKQKLCTGNLLDTRKTNFVKFQQTWSPQNIMRHFSTAEDTPDAFSRFSTGIDFDALRDARIKDLKMKGKDVHVHNIIRDIVKEKCDEAFANLNEDEQKQLKIAQLEHDFLFSQGYNIIPAEDMTSENWLDVINMTPGQRRQFFYFLQKRQYLRRKKFKTKERLVTHLDMERQPIHSPETSEDVDRLFLRLYPSTVKRWRNHKLSNSLCFGIPLVWDMEYTAYMASKEIKNTATQLLAAYCLNRSDPEMPFHMYYTSCPEHHSVYRYMQTYLQNDPHFMATVTPQNCLDIFDTKDLVYLSPNAPKVMDKFDPNCVYILGAFNDQSCQRPISYARAKELGIKCVRLPVDRYVQWKLGSKSLTLNQMMMIFQAIKNKAEWYDALSAIPTRKLGKFQPRYIDL